MKYMFKAPGAVNYGAIVTIVKVFGKRAKVLIDKAGKDPHSFKSGQHFVVSLDQLREATPREIYGIPERDDDEGESLESVIKKSSSNKRNVI